jgi:hypothetical protein
MQAEPQVRHIRPSACQRTAALPGARRPNSAHRRGLETGQGTRMAPKIGGPSCGCRGRLGRTRRRRCCRARRNRAAQVPGAGRYPSKGDAAAGRRSPEGSRRGLPRSVAWLAYQVFGEGAAMSRRLIARIVVLVALASVLFSAQALSAVAQPTSGHGRTWPDSDVGRQGCRHAGSGHL